VKTARHRFSILQPPTSPHLLLGSTLTLSLRFELSYGLSAAHGIFHGKKIPWEGELNLRFDP
jgi:hypothetical protein